MGYFLAKARDTANPVDRLIQCGTGTEWVQLSVPEKREICEEVARRFEVDDSGVSVLYYYVYLEIIFKNPKHRYKMISDVFIEAELDKTKSQEQPPSPEIPETIVWNVGLSSYIGVSLEIV
jgi:hypothetical protein